MSRLRRFPPQVADLILASGSEKQLESHRREITALFCDLRGFTGFTGSADAEDVIALLRSDRRNHYQVRQARQAAPPSTRTASRRDRKALGPYVCQNLHGRSIPISFKSFFVFRHARSAVRVLPLIERPAYLSRRISFAGWIRKRDPA
jgi:hypothetical protein